MVGNGDGNDIDWRPFGAARRWGVRLGRSTEAEERGDGDGGCRHWEVALMMKAAMRADNGLSCNMGGI